MSRAQLADERAAAWIIAQEDGPWSEADQAAFDKWLGESDGNRTAFLRLRHSWREADRIGALYRVQGAEEEFGRKSWTWWIPAAVAASLLAIIGTVYMVSVPEASRTAQIASLRYQTPLGGREVVELSDGSRVQLNTASVVRAIVSKRRREVWLDQGEAFFEVAHIEGQPFLVHAGNRQITVLGTKFSVRRDADRVTISVLEGRVRVDEIDGSTEVRSAIISGGDIALTRGDAMLVTTRSEARVERALAWRTGMLSFDQMRLKDVAAEFNRYNAHKMIVVDREAANFRIGGTFPASNPDAFVRLLRDAYGLKVEEREGTVRISS